MDRNASPQICRSFGEDRNCENSTQLPYPAPFHNALKLCGMDGSPKPQLGTLWTDGPSEIAHRSSFRKLATLGSEMRLA